MQHCSGSNYGSPSGAWEPNHLCGLTCWKVVSRRSSYCRDWHPNSTTYKPTNQNLHLQKVVHFITCAPHHLSFQGWVWLPRFFVQTSVVVWQASILEFVCRVLVWTCLLGPDTGNCGKFWCYFLCNKLCNFVALMQCFNLSPQILMQAEGGDLLPSMGTDKIDFLPIV